MYLQYCKTPGDKLAFALQFPLLFLRSKVFGKKLFELRFSVPVNGCRSVLAFLLENPADFVPRWFSEMKFRKGVFLDIGSNLAFFSAYYAKTTANPAIAFEINPQTADLVVSALADSRLGGKISLQNFGLSDSEGEVTISFNEKYSPLTSAVSQNIEQMEKEHATKFSSSEKAKTKTLDAVAGGLLQGRKISIVKIDVEGMEPNVLRGGLKTIRRHRPEIIFESNSDESYKEVCAILKKEKYEIKELNKNNFLAVPKT